MSNLDQSCESDRPEKDSIFIQAESSDSILLSQEISPEDIERYRVSLAKEFLDDSGKPTQLGHEILFSEEEL